MNRREEMGRHRGLEPRAYDMKSLTLPDELVAVR